MVAYMQERIHKEGWANARASQVSPKDPGLLPESVDRVLVVNTWHHLPDRREYLKKLRRGLKADGQVLIVDFTQEAPFGPPKAARLSAAEVLAEVEADGQFLADVVEESLPHQYVVRATAVVERTY